MGCIKEADNSDWRATVERNPEASQANQDATGDPVNVVTGAFTLDELDVSIPNRRLPLELRRGYNNQLHEAADGVVARGFGHGWSFSLGMRIDSDTNDGAAVYVDDRGNRLRFDTGADGVYQSPPGGAGLTLTGDADGFTLSQLGGVTARFTRDGRLLHLARPGPKYETMVELHYDTCGRLIEACAAAGRALRFTYDGEGLLVRQVSDHTDRRWEYSYNEHGELIAVQNPAGYVRRYEYMEWNGRVTEKPSDDDHEGECAARARVKTVTFRALRTVYQWSSLDEGPEIEAENQYTSERRVVAQRDALGHVTRFDYNRFTRTTCVTDPAGWTTVYSFDESGNTTRMRQPSGAIHEYIFDDRRNLIAEIDPLGNRTEYATLVDPARLQAQEELGRRAIGNRSRYVTLAAEDLTEGYDEHGNRPLVRNARGDVTRYVDYSAFGQPRIVIYPDGSRAHYIYDDQTGAPLRLEHRGRSGTAVRYRTWDYDGWGNVVLERAWAESGQGPGPARVTAFTYDAPGVNLLSRREWIELDGAGNERAHEDFYEWDSLGRLVLSTSITWNGPEREPQHGVTRYFVDALDRPTQQIQPDASALYWLYNAQGYLIERFVTARDFGPHPMHVPLDARLQRERWTVDALGREVEYIAPSGAQTERVWDERGYCVQEIDPLGVVIERSYDRDGNCVREASSRGYAVDRQMDPSGRVVREHHSAGYSVERVFDALGQVLELRESDGSTHRITDYGYDAMGALTSVHRSDGTWERRTYTDWGEVARREQGGARESECAVEEFDFDSLGRLVAVWDTTRGESDPRFTLRYDDTARCTILCNALGHESRTWYDSSARAIKQEDAEGRMVQLAYDALGRLVRQRSDDGTVDAQFSYDALGRLSEARQGPVVQAWTYNDSGQVLQSRQRVGDRELVIESSYDYAGRPVARTASADWSMALAYGSPGRDDMRITLPGASVEVRFNPAGWPVEERWSTGQRVTYAYDAFGDFASVRVESATGDVLFAQEIVRDPGGRPIVETRDVGVRSATYRYVYDSLGRLQSAERSFGEDAPERFREYRYDSRGNRIEEIRDGSLYAAYEYDVANQLTAVSAADGARTCFSYDRCGNLIEYPGGKLNYDAVQRPVALQQETGTTGYTYAATGERVEVRRADDLETRFFDGAQEILSVSCAGKARSFWGAGFDALLAWSAPGQSPQPAVTNWLGTVLGLADGRPLRDFDPFGNALGSETPSLPFGFCGKRFDVESGMYESRGRQYLPATGRFVQPDPLGIVDGPNLYVYARNNPLRYVDPSGLTSVKDAKGKIASAYETIFSERPEFEQLRPFKMEHYDRSGKLVATTYVKGPGFLGGGVHLETFDRSGRFISSTWPKGPGSLGGAPHLETFGRSNEFLQSTYYKPGGFISSPRVEQYGPSGKLQSTTYLKPPGALGGSMHLETFSPSNQLQVTTYLKPVGGWLW